eukprot:4727151-Heterocapsa_arctica.AAC.1
MGVGAMRSALNVRQLVLMSSVITGYISTATTLGHILADTWPAKGSVICHPVGHPDAGSVDVSTLATRAETRPKLDALNKVWIPILYELLTTCLPVLQCVSSALDTGLKDLCRSCSEHSKIYFNIVNLRAFRYPRPDFMEEELRSSISDKPLHPMTLTMPVLSDL